MITDKYLADISVFMTELPQIDLQICLFHVLRTFSRECTAEKLGITAAERHTVFGKLQYEYQRLYEEFSELSPNHLVKEYLTETGMIYIMSG